MKIYLDSDFSNELAVVDKNLHVVSGDYNQIMADYPVCRFCGKTRMYQDEDTCTCKIYVPSDNMLAIIKQDGHNAELCSAIYRNIGLRSLEPIWQSFSGFDIKLDTLENLAQPLTMGFKNVSNLSQTFVGEGFTSATIFFKDWFWSRFELVLLDDTMLQLINAEDVYELRVLFGGDQPNINFNTIELVEVGFTRYSYDNY